MGETMAHDGSITAVSAIVKDSTKLVSCGLDGFVALHDIGRGAIASKVSIQGHCTNITASCSTSIPGLDILTASKDGSLAAWDLRMDTAVVQAAAKMTSTVSALETFGDEYIAIVGCADGSVGLCDLRVSIRPHISMKVHAGLVGSLRRRPGASSGHQVASSSDDGTVLVWDASTLTGEAANASACVARQTSRDLSALGVSQDGEMDLDSISKPEPKFDFAGDRDGEADDLEVVPELGPSRAGPRYGCEEACGKAKLVSAVTCIGTTQPDYVRAVEWVSEEALWTGCWDRAVRRFNVTS